MNHVFRNRVWPDDPVSPKDRANRYAIDRVSLRVARGKTSGRWEAHNHSWDLLLRLHKIGVTPSLVLKGLQIAQTAVPQNLVRGLSMYLKAGKGIQSFRRETKSVLITSKADLVSLLSRVGINYHSYVPEPTDKVPAGRGDPCGA